MLKRDRQNSALFQIFLGQPIQQWGERERERERESVCERERGREKGRERKVERELTEGWMSREGGR